MISEFFLFVFTLLGGAAAGAYAVSACFPPKADEKQSWLLPLTALVLLAISGVALLLHLGRPERVLLAFGNMSAGIAQEGVATIAFGLLVFADLIVSKVKGASVRAIRIAAGIAGVILTCIMAGAYFSYTVQHAWSSWQTFPLFVVGALALGIAVVAAFDDAFYSLGAKRICAVAFYGLFAVSAALEAAHFAGIGSTGFVPLVIGAVVAVVAAALPLAMKSVSSKTLSLVELVIVFAAVAVARYGFYMAYVG